MTTGEKIKDLRKKAGLTQRELAEKAGIATITLQQYELGKREPRIKQLQLIANALGCPVERLINTGRKKKGLVLYYESKPIPSDKEAVLNIKIDSELYKLLVLIAKCNDTSLENFVEEILFYEVHNFIEEDTAENDII